MPDTELGPTAGTNLGQIQSALKDFQIQWCDSEHSMTARCDKSYKRLVTKELEDS